MSVRPSPSTTVAFAGTAVAPPIFEIRLPTTMTVVLPVRACDFPSNTFTFLNATALGGWISRVAGGSAECAGGP